MFKMQYKQEETQSLYILCAENIQWLYEYDSNYVKSIVQGLIDLGD